MSSPRSWLIWWIEGRDHPPPTSEPGILAPVATLKGRQFVTSFRFVPMAKVRALFAR
jgi:hypothetical protein